MSAQTMAEALRQAAYEIRDDVNVATRGVRPFLVAVADFLDACAVDADGTGALEQCDSPFAVKEALKIARAYLGNGAS
jgi:hypothetical protein